MFTYDVMMYHMMAPVFSMQTGQHCSRFFSVVNIWKRFTNYRQAPGTRSCQSVSQREMFPSLRWILNTDDAADTQQLCLPFLQQLIQHEARPISQSFYMADGCVSDRQAGAVCRHQWACEGRTHLYTPLLLSVRGGTWGGARSPGCVASRGRHIIVVWVKMNQ